MNVLKNVAYVTIISIEQMKFRINHFLGSNEFHRRCREEQYRLHRKNAEHVQQFLETMKKPSNK